MTPDGLSNQRRDGGHRLSWREKFFPGWRALGAAALEVVFPRWCVGCGALMEAGPLRQVCRDCLANFAFVHPPHCATCGTPFYGAVEGARRCPRCVDFEPAFGEGRVGFLLDGVARAFIHELKFRTGTHLRGDLPVLAGLTPTLVEFVRGAVLVPVPLHPRRFRDRGFNQARWVAEAFAQAAGGGAVDDLLARVRDTPTQTRLDRAARQANMKGAFALAPGVKISPTLRYIVVDDVFTTGATLHACAQTLRRAGAGHIDVAALGHG